MLIPPRETATELLDEHDAPAEAMRRSLRDLRRFNRYGGGARAYRHLLRRIVDHREPISLLDLGTGTSDLPGAVRRHWHHAHATGLDQSIRHLEYGRELGVDNVSRVAGDALHLPFRDDSFDVVASSHFFHHFSPDDNVNILTESLRVARRAVMVTDTRRHYVPLAFVRLLGVLRLVGEITRFDAPASVRQGYTPTEVREIAARTGRRFELCRLYPYRFGLVVWK